MLNDFCTTVDVQKRQDLLKKLSEAANVNKNAKLVKRSLISIQEIFISEDPASLLTTYQALLVELQDPKSEIDSRPSYIEIMIRYFVATLSFRMGDAETALTEAKRLLDKDIKGYFGHLQTDVAIEPRLIILNCKFDTLTQSPISEESSTEERMAYGKLF